MSAPLLAGAVHVTVSCLSPAVRVGAAGASGRCAAGVALAVADHGPSPCSFVAANCTSYSEPFVSPVIVALVVVPVEVKVRLVHSVAVSSL